MSTSSRCIPRHPANKSARTKSPQIRNFRIINVRSSLKLESRRVHVISKLPSCPTHFHPFSIRGTMILMIVTDNRIRITRITRIIRFIIWSNNREESSENREKNSVLLSRELKISLGFGRFGNGNWDSDFASRYIFYIQENCIL